MKRILLFGICILMLFCVKAQPKTCRDTTWTDPVENITKTFNNTGDFKTESMLWVMPRLNGNFIPVSKVSCMKFYVALETEAVTTTSVTLGLTPEIDMAGSSDFAKCFLTYHDVGTVTTTQAIIALGNIDADGSSIASSPVNTQFVDLGGLLGLSVEFRDFDFGTLSADNVSANYNLHIVITYDCDGINEISDNIYPAGTWNYEDKLVDFTGGGSEIQVPDLQVCEGNEGYVMAAVTGFDPGYTVSFAPIGTPAFNTGWATFINDTVKVSASAAVGTYQVGATVTSGDGATTAVDTFEVKVKGLPNIQITQPGADTAICKVSSPTGTPVNLTAANGDKYKWSYINGNASVMTGSANWPSGYGNLAAANASIAAYVNMGGAHASGDVKFVVTGEQNGCQNTDTVTITVLTAPTVTLTLSSNTVCEGEALTLTPSEVTGGTVGVDRWVYVNPANGPTTAADTTVYPVYVAPGTITYEVKGYKGTCESNPATKQVTVFPKPKLTASMPAVCVGDTVKTGNLTITATDQGGNSLPAAALPLHYSGFYADATCTAAADTIPSAAGTLSYWVIGETQSGCKDTVKVDVNVNALPAAPSLSVVADQCNGEDILLTATGGTYSQYRWTDGTATWVTNSATYTDAAPYQTAVSGTFPVLKQYKVTGYNGTCWSEASSAGAVNIHDLPAVDVTDPTGNPLACSGDTIEMTATPTLSSESAAITSYSWTGGTVLSGNTAVAEVVVGDNNNNYQVKVTDANGCEATASIVVTGVYLQTKMLTASPSTHNPASPVIHTLSASGNPNVGMASITDYTFIQKIPNGGIVQTGTSHQYTTPSNFDEVPTYCVVFTTTLPSAEQCLDTVCQPIPFVESPLGWGTRSNGAICYGDTDFAGINVAASVIGGLPSYTYTWKLTGCNPMPAGENLNSLAGNVITFTGTNTRPQMRDTLKISNIDYSKLTATTTFTFTIEVRDSKTPISNTLAPQQVTVTVVKPDLKINTADTGMLEICRDEALTLTAAFTGGGTPAYSWFEPAGLTAASGATQTISTNTADETGTIYRVGGTLTTSGVTCADTAWRKVVIHELPAVTLTADKDTVCEGTTVTLTAGGSAGITNYTWTGGVSDAGAAKTSVSKAITTATSFTVEVTGAHGCKNDSTLTIGIYTPEVLVVSNDTAVCSNANTLTLHAGGLTPGSSTQYVWSGSSEVTGATVNALSQTVSPTATTTYQVNGTDVHGCTVAAASIVVTVDDMPAFALQKHDLSACGSVNLDSAVNWAVTSAGTTLEYASDAAFTTPESKTVNTAGTYYIRATNGACETASDTVRVTIMNAPVLSVTNTASVCEPDSVDLAGLINWAATTFTASDLSYWDGATELVSTKVSPSAGTPKTYTIKGSSTGCTPQSQNVTVTIDPKPVLAISVSDTAVCTATADLSAAVTVSNGVSVTKTYFSDATYTTAIGSSVATSGTYYVIGETAETCRDSIDVTVRIKPHPAVTLTLTDDTVCMNGTVDVTVNGGSAGDTYGWEINGSSVAGTSSVLTTPALTASTTVTVTVTNTESCTTVLDTTIGIYTPEVISITPAVTAVCAGDSITLTAGGLTTAGGAAAAGNAYQWSEAGGSLTGGTDGLAIKVAHHYNPGGSNTYTYTVNGTDVHGCTATAGTATLTVNELPVVAINDTLKSCSNVALTTANTNLGLNYTPADAAVTFATDRDFTLATANAATTGMYYVKATKASCSVIDSIWVEITGSLTLEVEDTLAVCDAAGTRNLKDAITNAVNLIDTTFWTTNTGGILSGQMTDAEIAAAATGTYYVKGNGGDCDVVRTVKVVNMKPVITVTDPSAVCANDSIDLATAVTQVAGITYTYYDGTTALAAVSGNVWVKTAGTYQVMAENPSGCRDTQDIVVPLFNELPSVTLSADGECIGELITVTATVTGGGTVNDAGYTWTGATQSAGPNGHQATLTLTAAGQSVGVQVTDDKGCSAQVDSVFTGQVCDILVVQVPDAVACSADSEVKLTAQASGGTVTGWTWTQIAGPTTAVITPVDSVLTVSTAGLTIGDIYRFEVSVNGGAAKDTAELILYRSPEITLTKADSCGNQAKVELTLTNATTHNWYAKSGWSLSYETTAKMTAFVKKPVNQTAYTVSVIASNEHCRDSAGVAGEVLDLELKLDFVGGDTCVSELPLDLALNPTYNATSTGHLELTYDYTPLSGGAPIQQTQSDVDKITANGYGKYRLLSIADTRYNQCVVTLKDSLTINEMPELQLNEHCIALNKDSIFNLKVVNKGNFDYIWGVTAYNTAASAWETTTGDGTVIDSIQVVMGDKDLRYILTASNKDLPACASSDTAYAYLIPDAPVIDIDTNTNRHNIHVHWNEVTGADSYELMHMLWDGYAIIGSYQLKQTNAAGDTSYRLTTLSDTLEFYYVTSTRSICGTNYRSVSSDTVGYFRQFLFGFTESKWNPSLGLTGSYTGRSNWISYPFDMTRKGIATARDVFEKLIGRVGCYYAYADGKISCQGVVYKNWNGSVFEYNEGLRELNCLDFTGNGGCGSSSYTDGVDGLWDSNMDLDGDSSPDTDFDMIPGQIYNIQVYDSIHSTELLLYGKLPGRYTYEYRYIVNSSLATDLSTDNWFAAPLGMYVTLQTPAGGDAREELGNDIAPNMITKELDKIGLWDFFNQGTGKTALNWLDFNPSPGMWDPEDPSVPQILIKPWSPVLIQMNSYLGITVINWTK